MSKDAVNILLVDDLPDKLLSLRTVLEELGQNVITAQSGREALRRLLDDDFAVILLDVNMPDIDGFETAALIRQRRRCAHTPIIFITAFADEIHTSRAYDLGAVDYILSPVVPEILRTKVSVFVELYKKTEQVKRHAEKLIALAREQAARAAAEESTRRSMFLAEASRVLASSLKFDMILPGLSRLVVPYLADLGVVTCCDVTQRKWRTELSWVDAEHGSASQATIQSGLLNPVLEAALQRVLEKGKPEFLPADAENEASHPPTEAPSQVATLAIGPLQNPGRPGGPSLPALEIASTLIIPLIARSRTVGAMLLARSAFRPPYSHSDLPLAEDLAARAAISLENGWLYQNIQDADQRKNEFLAMLAHELRNPLAPIRNAVQIVRLGNQADPDQVWALDVIDRQMQQMVRMVDDLLEVSRITRGKIKLQLDKVETTAIISRALETSRLAIESREHELSVEVPAEPIWVEGDLTRLAQVVTNLLNNAAKYTEKGGKIGLKVERAGKDVMIAVRDSGVGIPADMLGSVFDLFYQGDRSLDRSQGGLGIGLTLVHRIVEMHGGKVEALSEGLGQGSEFRVRLPLCTKGRDTPRVAGPSKDGKKFAARRILIVDDNQDAAMSLAMVLRSTGHEVRIFHDGFSALEAAPGFQPEIVMLDIGMPKMDGYEVAENLRQQPWFQDVALIAITGYGQEEDYRRSEKAGFAHHLVKPVDPQGLKALIASMVVRLTEAPPEASPLDGRRERKQAQKNASETLPGS